MWQLVSQERFSLSHMASFLLCFVCVCVFSSTIEVVEKAVFKSLTLIFVCNSLKHTKIMFLPREDTIPKH